MLSAFELSCLSIVEPEGVDRFRVQCYSTYICLFADEIVASVACLVLISGSFVSKSARRWCLDVLSTYTTALRSLLRFGSGAVLSLLHFQSFLRLCLSQNVPALSITTIISEPSPIHRSTIYDTVYDVRKRMAVQSKLLLLPDELLLFIGQLSTFDAEKALRSCNRTLFRLLTPTVCVSLTMSGPFTIHPYTATCIRSLTLNRTVMSDALWITVTTIHRLETLRLHSVQFTNPMSPTKLVHLQRVCLAGITNFRPALQFILARLRQFWYLKIHGYNPCTFRERISLRASSMPSDALRYINVNGAIGRVCATLPKLMNLSYVTTIDINVQLGGHLIQMTLDCVAKTLMDLVLRNIGVSLSGNLVFLSHVFVGSVAPTLVKMTSLKSVCITFNTTFRASAKHVLITTLNLPMLDNIFVGLEQYYESHRSDICALMATMDSNFAERENLLTVGVWFSYRYTHLSSLGQTMPLPLDSYNALATDLRAAAPRLAQMERLVFFPQCVPIDTVF